MTTNNYFYDENCTRYQLVKSIPGDTLYNWLFLPGGPGIDTDYFLDLINTLDVAGNYWLIDLPENGSNTSGDSPENSTFEQWGHYLLAGIKKFDHAILVGHSFGGYFPLFLPQLENLLKGFIILNSVPTAESEEFEKCVIENKLPSREDSIKKFLDNPTLETIKSHYLMGTSYAFTPAYLEKGKNLVDNLSYSVPVSYWWYTEGYQQYKNITWIPKKVPVLIVGASHDFVTPSIIFKQDTRFHQANIKMIDISDAGHFPWVEQPLLVKEAFKMFSKNMTDYTPLN